MMPAGSLRTRFNTLVRCLERRSVALDQEVR
jgi:hypothetical protein